MHYEGSSNRGIAVSGGVYTKTSANAGLHIEYAYTEGEVYKLSYVLTV
jgi:hypothetical protein